MVSATAWLRPRGRYRVLALAGVGVLLVGIVAAAAAAARVGGARGTILAGVRVGGVDVGGMTRQAATAAVAASARRELGHPITVRAAGRTWRVTAASLGRRAAVAQAVDRAVRGPRLPWWSRVWHRLSKRPVRFSVDLARVGGERGVRALVRTVAGAVATAPHDASISLVDGRVLQRHAGAGRALDVRRATRLLDAALVRTAPATVRLPLRAVPAAVPDSALGKTITVDAGSNRLTLYDGLTVERTYPVATARPGFYTPRGTWKVLYKEVNPTWHNPAPNGWGKGEPLVIPPGPDNPLGTRALALNAAGILIHGSPSSWSIGHYASHGCIRMFIADAEDLFPRVPAGTPVLVFASRFLLGGKPAPGS